MSAGQWNLQRTHVTFEFPTIYVTISSPQRGTLGGSKTHMCVYPHTHTHSLTHSLTHSHTQQGGTHPGQTRQSPGTEGHKNIKLIIRDFWGKIIDQDGEMIKEILNFLCWWSPREAIRVIFTEVKGTPENLKAWALFLSWAQIVCLVC